MNADHDLRSDALEAAREILGDVSASELIEAAQYIETGSVPRSLVVGGDVPFDVADTLSTLVQERDDAWDAYAKLSQELAELESKLEKQSHRIECGRSLAG